MIRRYFSPTQRLSRYALWLIFGITGGLTGCNGDVGFGGGQDQDPVVVDTAVAYVKRPLALDGASNPVQPDARRVVTFEPGASLMLRDRASATAAERSLTDNLFLPGERYDVRDLDVSYDGTKLIFSLRGPYVEGGNEDDQPTWNIWEYDAQDATLRRIIASDITAEEGHDLAPHYLPDGRILFNSTRQRQSRAILLDEGKTQFATLDEDRREHALVLHVMNDDGSDIHQISFNQSHDLDPSVLTSGRVVFSRWDHMGGRNGIHLYHANPDGTDLEALYGVHSHDTGTAGTTVQFLQPREMPDGRLMAVLRPFTGTDGGGDLVAIDFSTYSDNQQPTWVNIGLLGNGQTSVTAQEVRTDTEPSPGGRYRSAYPLWDGTSRLLVSWSPCRLVEAAQIVPCTPARLADPAAQAADPLFGIWIYDTSAGTQTPILQPAEGTVYSEVVAMLGRNTTPSVIFDKQPGVDLDSDLITEGVGILHIRSVYDVDGTDTASPSITTLRDPALTTAANRPARFLRVVKAVSIPDRNVRDFTNSSFGVSTQQLMREIVGYAPIEPDGSVKIKVPANAALAISVVDANGRRIGGRHRSWIQLKPGEELECVGCHAATSTMPHGRRSAAPASVNPGAPNTGIPFPNTESALWADIGESMAETRARISCQTDCAALNPSMDIVYDDVWTDPAVRAKDASFAYRYSDLATPAPTACTSAWNSLCRTVINYEQHIHPLWSLPRTVAAADVTCTSCHNIVDAMSNPKVPDGQLDLSDGPSDLNADHFKAYRELLSQDNALELVGTMLQEMAGPVIVNPSLSAAGAAASSTFFSRFDVGGSHEGYLSPAELKLIAEWADLGAQYYNDPFTAPIN